MEEDMVVTEMDIVEEAHLRIDALLLYLEEKGVGSAQEFESFFEEYVEAMEDEDFDEE